MITLDGGTGDVIIGEVDLVPPQINEDFETLLGWADEIRRLRVRANADTPEDATKAREFGAEGIGLCRTEHMFMTDERLPAVRAMIMASNEEERREALAQLLRSSSRTSKGSSRRWRACRDDPLARPAAARVPATARPGGLAGDGAADTRLARDQSDARDARVPPRPSLSRDLRDAGARDHPPPSRSSSARATRRSSRSCIRSSALPRSSSASVS